jgi:hypothetical protein
MEISVMRKLTIWPLRSVTITGVHELKGFDNPASSLGSDLLLVAAPPAARQTEDNSTHNPSMLRRDR